MGSENPSPWTLLVRQGQRNHHHPEEVRSDDENGSNGASSAKFEEEPGWVGRLPFCGE